MSFHCACHQGLSRPGLTSVVHLERRRAFTAFQLMFKQRQTQSNSRGAAVGEPALRVTLTRKEKVQQRRAIDMLQRHCRSLQAWGTSLQSDEDLFMTESELSPRRRQAICARVEHKMLIEAAQSVLQTYHESLTDTAVLSRILSK